MYVKIVTTEYQILIPAKRIEEYPQKNRINITDIIGDVQSFSFDPPRGAWLYIMNNEGDTIQKTRIGKEPKAN